MMSFTFGLFTQVSGSGPLGPLVCFTDLSCSTNQCGESQAPVRCTLLPSDNSCNIYLMHWSYQNIVFANIIATDHIGGTPFSSSNQNYNCYIVSVEILMRKMVYLSMKKKIYYIEDIYFFEVNTKYISSSVLKISEISRVRSTSEIADIFNT